MDCGHVASVASGVHEVVEVDVERGAEVEETLGIVPYEIGDASAGGFGGTHVLEGIVVGSAHQTERFAPQPSKPSDGIDLAELERVPEVGGCVDVRQAGSE